MTKVSTYYVLSCVLIAYAILLSSCANRIPPSGGPRDESPPIAQQMEPANFKTNFDSERISIKFNEYFVLDDPFNQIVVSPPLPTQPKYKIRGKSLVINLNNELSSNTTYTINFGDAIKDFNERNTLKNFTYIFSTGDWLDSLEVSGKIFAAYDNSAEEDVLALLYRDLNDTAVITKKPFYFTKTDQQGNFKISNIGEGNYRLYGLKDNNLNYIFDQNDELIGFIDDTIKVIDSAKNNRSISIFEETPDRIRIIETFSKETGLYQFIFNTGIQTISLDTEIFREGDFAVVSETKDSLSFWTSNYSVERASFYLTINDTLKDTVELSNSTIAEDSLQLPRHRLKFKTKKSTKGKANTATNKRDLYKPVEISFNRPIIQADFSKIKLLEDTIETEVVGQYELNQETKSSLIIDYQWIGGLKYRIEIPDSTFLDLFGIYNSKLIYRFEIKEKEAYGSIKLNVVNSDKQKFYVFEIFNSNGKIVERKPYKSDDGATVTFDNFIAGNYTLKVFEDRNQNGIWDTGNLKEKRQAEKTIQYAKNVTLKANWEMELDVKLKQ